MIRVEGLTKTYEGQTKNAEPAVAELSFENDTGKFLTLLGPSGCGKSTTLRCIAGLETPDAGEIEIGSQIVFSVAERIDLSPAKRRIGMVFQSYAIWPHMTVLENVAYPLRFRDVSAAERRKRVHEVLEIVGLDALADRPAPRLSGGQQQRVALARALVGEPEVLLLDEPLSNLDTNLRRELGGYVRQLQQDLALTVIYVTHDRGEAMSMSDSIALMDQGRIAEQGEPVSMYTRPRTRFAASSLGDANYLPAESVELADGATFADTAEGRITVRTAQPEEDATTVARSVMIRPESFVLSSDAPAKSQAWNTFECKVQSRRYFGLHWEYRLHTQDGWELTAKGLGGHPVEAGALVWATAAADDCIVVSDERMNTRQVASSDSGGEPPDPIRQEESAWLGGNATEHKDREKFPDEQGGMRLRIRTTKTDVPGKNRVLSVLVLMALVVASCGGDTGTSETTATTIGPTDTTSGFDGEDPLAELAAAAEAEGGSLEYSFVLGEEYLGPLINAFRERYPFAEVNITTGGALQLIEKVLSETQTNNPLTDMIQGGPLEDAVLCKVENLCYDFVPEGAADVPEELRFEGAPFVVPAYFTFHIAYNTDVVSADEAPTNLADFAEPEWSGRFGIDLEVIDWFAAELAYYGEEEGLELFERIAANDPVIYSGAAGYEQLAAGSLPAIINAYSLLLPQYVEAGAPIAVAQADHMIALPDEFIGINTTDNPALLELFLEWLFTEEAQNIQPQSLGKTPVVPGIPVPDTLAALSGSCTGDCELFFGTSENFGDFDIRVEQFQELFVSP